MILDDLIMISARWGGGIINHQPSLSRLPLPMMAMMAIMALMAIMAG